MNSKTAKDLSDSFHNERILTNIRDAAKNGSYEIKETKYNDNIITKLTSLGFIIARGDSHITIKWHIA